MRVVSVIKMFIERAVRNEISYKSLRNEYRRLRATNLYGQLIYTLINLLSPAIGYRNLVHLIKFYCAIYISKEDEFKKQPPGYIPLDSGYHPAS